MVRGNFAYCSLYWRAAKTEISMAVNLTHLKPCYSTGAICMCFRIRFSLPAGLESMCLWRKKRRDLIFKDCRGFLKPGGAVWSFWYMRSLPFCPSWAFKGGSTVLLFLFFVVFFFLKLRLENLVWLAAFVIRTSGSAADGFVCCIWANQLILALNMPGVNYFSPWCKKKLQSEVWFYCHVVVVMCSSSCNFLNTKQ